MNIPDFSGLLAALADAAIKTAVLLALAGAVVLTLRRASAALRHLVWSAATAGALLLPVLSLTLPEWRVPGLPDWRPAPPQAAIAAPAPATLPASTPAAPAAYESSPFENPSYSVPSNSILGPTAIQPIAPPPPFNWRHWAGAAWLAGAALALLPLALGTWQVARLTHGCSPVNEASLLSQLAALGNELGLRRRVRLLGGPAIVMPLTWGAWRPALLLPADTAAWTPDRLRLVLLHELAHIKRGDWLTQTLAYLACALYWFNPLAWLAAREMRREREQACDDLVLRAGATPRAYASELLALAAHLGGRGFVNWAAVPMARRSSLETRLRAILDTRRSRAALTRALLFAALALLGLVVVPLAMLRAANSPADSIARTRAGMSALTLPTARFPLRRDDLVKLIGAAELSPEELAARLRAWIEREGVPFPEGAKTSFADGTLTVTNTEKNLAQVRSALSQAGVLRQVEIEARMLEITSSVQLPDGVLTQTQLDGLEQSIGVSMLSAPKVTMLSGKTAEISVGQELRVPQEYPNPTNFDMEQIGVVLNVTAFVEESGINYVLRFTHKELVNTDGNAERTATTTRSVEVRSAGRVANGETVRFDMGAIKPGSKGVLFITMNEISHTGQPVPRRQPVSPAPPPGATPTTPTPPQPEQPAPARAAVPPAPEQPSASVAPDAKPIPVGEVREAALVSWTEQLVNLPHLDLETGRQADITIFSCGYIVTWRRDNGMDLDLTVNATASDTLPVVGYAEMNVAPMDPPPSGRTLADYTEADAFRALANLPPSPAPSAAALFFPEERAAANRQTLDPARDKTNTYAFRTREGAIGVLQIVPYPAAPAGALLHYRIVAHASEPTAAEPGSMFLNATVIPPEHAAERAQNSVRPTPVPPTKN